MDVIARAQRVMSALDGVEVPEETFHPDALLATVASGGAFVPASDTLGAVRQAQSTDRLYTTTAHSLIALDEHAVVVTGNARTAAGDGGFSLGTRCWLYTFVDGLLYRGAVYDTRAEAEAAYAEHGIDLGVP